MESLRGCDRRPQTLLGRRNRFVTQKCPETINRRCAAIDTEEMAVLVMLALEFENQLALGLGYSDSSSTLAQAVVRTDPCA